MGIKNQLIKTPFIGRFGKFIINNWRDKSDWRIIDRLGKLPHPVAKQIHKVLIDFNENRLDSKQDWTKLIEAERDRLLTKERLLVDDSFDAGGLYDDGKTIQEVCLASRDSFSALFLYLLTKELKPEQAIELGTNVGISSAYIAAAQQSIENVGRLITMDASPYRQKLAKEIHQNLGLENIDYVQGLFYDTLEPTVNRMGQIDFAFIDGHHKYQPTMDYFEKIIPFCMPGSVLIFDDIRYSEGMKRAWAELSEDNRFDLVIDLKNLGLCVCSKSKNSARYVLPTIHNVFHFRQVRNK